MQKILTELSKLVLPEQQLDRPLCEFPIANPNSDLTIIISIEPGLSRSISPARGTCRSIWFRLL